MIIISNCGPSQSSKLYGKKGFLNPGRLENLEGEFKIVLMFSGGFNSFRAKLESCLQTCMTYTIAECTVNKLLMTDRRNFRNL